MKMSFRGLQGIVMTAVLIAVAGCATVDPYTPPIKDAAGNDAANSINTIETVVLGGVEQTITIRALDHGNPVLLYLHGGPGLPESPWATWNGYRAELEAAFVLVYWDQRGAGKSYSKDLTADDMHVENFVNDVLELTDLLRARFGKDKIFLWGHSWGSGLGFETLRVDSEPYYAFFASAVRPDWNTTQRLGYQRLLQLAREAEDSKAVEALTAIQPFDPADREHLEVRGTYLSRYRAGDFHTAGLEQQFYDYAIKGGSPEYPRSTVRNTFAGIAFSRETIGKEIINSGYDHARDFPVSGIPVHFLAGRHDCETPGELAYGYFEKLEAPAKSFTWFESSAHNLHYDEPDRFNQAIITIARETLRP